MTQFSLKLVSSTHTKTTLTDNSSHQTRQYQEEQLLPQLQILLLPLHLLFLLLHHLFLLLHHLFLLLHHLPLPLHHLHRILHLLRICHYIRLHQLRIFHFIRHLLHLCQICTPTTIPTVLLQRRLFLPLSQPIFQHLLHHLRLQQPRL